MPGSPVPVSLQTLGVVGAGLALGPGAGAGAVGLYLFAGAIDLPVFADGRGGLAALFGPTGGYLFGFVLGAALTGWMVWRRGRPSIWMALPAALIGQLVVLALGVPWLAIATGRGAWEALSVGAWPFLPGMVLKAVVAASVWMLWIRFGPRRWRAIRSRM